MGDPPWVNIEDYWQDYLDFGIPIEASDHQRLESQKVFYAGALAMFALIGEVKAKLPREAWPSHMDKVHGHITDFFLQVYNPATPDPTLH